MNLVENQYKTSPLNTRNSSKITILLPETQLTHSFKLFKFYLLAVKMLFFKTILVAVLGLGAMTIAAPVDNTVAVGTTTANVADGCNNAYRGDHGSCERGREEKHDGRREENKGAREIEHGNYGKGMRDEERGHREEKQGQHRECRNGGHC